MINEIGKADCQRRTCFGYAGYHLRNPLKSRNPQRRGASETTHLCSSRSVAWLHVTRYHRRRHPHPALAQRARSAARHRCPRRRADSCGDARRCSSTAWCNACCMGAKASTTRRRTKHPNSSWVATSCSSYPGSSWRAWQNTTLTLTQRTLTCNPNPHPNPKPKPSPNPSPNPSPDPSPDPNPDPSPDPNPDPSPNQARMADQNHARELFSWYWLGTVALVDGVLWL